MKSRRDTWISLLNPGLEINNAFYAEREALYREYVSDLHTPVPVAELIDKDIRRTKITPVCGMYSDYLESVRHGEPVKNALARILQVYVHTNKSIGYVQGMNIVCAIMYYVLSRDDLPYSESATYFCFFNLMADIGDLFTEKMDKTETGLFGQQKMVLRLLKKKDPKLHARVLQKDLFNRSAFHVRWMVLLFSAEFTLGETMLVWDRFFEETPKGVMIPYFCASLLLLLRERILKDDEMEVLTTLEVVKVSPRLALDTAERLLKETPYSVLAPHSAARTRAAHRQA
ncbi:TBC1 domain family member 13 [Nematocida major]|uniref:TBC1 domain family member 13 n=1 Tax=Nematocida major TaxID=1912982 RepID=UPI0020087FE3|nr:TBC1 domain family member 13 [Nematocida major]KAH9386885.1 TBC1 domain family member 13 [Nematocida major]